MKKLFIQIVIGLALFLVLDLVVSRLGLAGSSASNKQDAINRAFRIPHELFHHALVSGFVGHAQWGRLVYPVRTNDLGFLDHEPRMVAKTSPKTRLLIAGDSFGEGIGYPWEQTFAGILAAARPDLEILNASVSSYSTIIHYRKIRELLDQGYHLDHVVVMLDISDIQDETAYAMTDDRVTYRSEPTAAPSRKTAVPNAQVPSVASRVEALEKLLLPFQLSSLVLDLMRAAYRSILGYDLVRVFNDCRSAWTYDRGNPATEAHYQDVFGGGHQMHATCPRNRSPAPIPGAAPPGHIDRAIGRAQHWMTALHAVLAAHDIKLSVGVYPWPAQLYHDDRDSLQVRLWRDWCASRCSTFIDFFPDFFDYKSSHARSWYRDLFIVGDVHFSALGNSLIARKLVTTIEGVK